MLDYLLIDWGGFASRAIPYTVRFAPGSGDTLDLLSFRLLFCLSFFEPFPEMTIPPAVRSGTSQTNRAAMMTSGWQ